MYGRLPSLREVLQIQIAQFMASPVGRWGRIILGVALLLIAFLALEGAARWIVAVLALVPLAAGGANFCIFAPVLRTPFRGKDLPRK